MFPAELPEAVRDNPKRSGEVRVYDALASAAALKGFTVWYSPRWLSGYRGVLRDGEADFILASPDIGYLVVEVKGGRIRRNAETGAWIAIDRDDEENTIENPVEQAMKSKKVLLSYLQKHWPGGKSPWIWSRHGVVLPHASRPRAADDLGASMPLEIFAFAEDMDKLGARLIQMLLWQPEGVAERAEPLGAEGMRLIEQFCGRDVAFDPSLKVQLEDAEAKIFRLTEEQNRLLTYLQHIRTAQFVGGAGTGKTVLAAAKARILSAAEKTVLVVCFNRPLRAHLKRLLSDTSAEVSSFHELCFEACRRAGIETASARRSAGDGRFLAEVLPALMEEAVLGGGAATYDAVLIDEAQDFREDWLDACRRLVRPEGAFYVFSDDNQNLYGGAKLDARFGEVIPLRDNLRNSRPIFEVCSRFYRGDELRCRGPKGPEVRWVEATPDRVARAVEKQINTLVLNEGVPREDIAVLTGCAVERSPFAGFRHIGEHPVCDGEQTISGRLTLDSVYRYKGLEKPVVVLTAMDNCTTEPELPYVGLSRAKSLMIVVGSPATLALLRNP